ncbi:hypothetical protein Clacol_000612 [Clathrus columnatus]|uniref:Uncharacterized protein n=1 Tax=Clathrus columnatus TaxID=1419009 RepID=A0AAV4ZWT2_9AGAM|nr:hypothetical protein Clacol_000612 [Clathrus columnatus]
MSFPSLPNPADSPSVLRQTSSSAPPIPLSPSLRKFVALSSYIGCTCSSESLPEGESTFGRNSHLEIGETKDVDTLPPSPGVRKRYTLKRAMRRVPVPTTQPSSPAEFERDSPSLPVLTLPPPLRESLDTGLGWTDEFGIQTLRVRHRPWLTSGGSLSEFSQQTTWSQPSRPASRQSMRDKTPSRDFFNAQEESLALKTPMTVLETEQPRLGTLTEWTPMSSAIFAEAETSTLRRNTSQVRFREHLDDSRPPRVSLQVRTSDDWATTVLKAIDETNDG